MAMWLVDTILHGFQDRSPDWRIQAFRVFFGVACTAKFTVALGHGGLARMAPGSLGWFQMRAAFGDRRGGLLADAYRPVLIVRLVAAVAVLCGFGTPIALLVVLADKIGR